MDAVGQNLPGISFLFLLPPHEANEFQDTADMLNAHRLQCTIHEVNDNCASGAGVIMTDDLVHCRVLVSRLRF